MRKYFHDEKTRTVYQVDRSSWEERANPTKRNPHPPLYGHNSQVLITTVSATEAMRVGEQRNQFFRLSASRTAEVCDGIPESAVEIGHEAFDELGKQYAAEFVRHAKDSKVSSGGKP